MVAKFSLVEDPEKLPEEPPEKAGKAGDTLGGTNDAEAPTTRVLELMQWKCLAQWECRRYSMVCWTWKRYYGDYKKNELVHTLINIHDCM